MRLNRQSGTVGDPGPAAGPVGSRGHRRRAGSTRLAAIVSTAAVTLLAIPALALVSAAAPAGASVRGAAIQSSARAKHSSKISVSAKPATAVAGTSVTLSAAVRSSGATPAGTVSFSTGKTELCSARLSRGSTHCAAKFPVGGTYTVTARYSGDGTHAEALGTTRVTATRAATSTAISVSKSALYPGEAVTLTATVSSRSPLIPTGTVTFTDASGALCTGKLSGGKAHCAYTPKAAGGAYTLTGRYGGDAAHAASSGKSAAIKVTKVPTTTEITSITPGTVPAGGRVTVAVAVTSDLAGAPAATGTVTVAPSDPKLAGVAGYSCTVALKSASDGTGTCRVTPPTGTYGDIHYDATYNGDAAHSTSAYAGGYLVVVPDVTTTAVSFSPATGTIGEPDTITATVTNQAGDNISPTAGGTGTVTFSIGGTPIAGCGDVPLTYSKSTGNTATCLYSPTAAGSVTVTAAYSGDNANLKSSGSAALSAS
jgi:hypothetical protein